MAEMAETVVKRILASRNHFEVLDIPPVAVDVGTVTKLYRRLALKVHPDKCRHADGPKAFLRISEAHEVLHDPSGQRTYLGSVHSITRAAEAEKKAWFWQKREAAEARKAAEEAAAREAEEAEERGVRNAAKQDPKTGTRAATSAGCGGSCTRGRKGGGRSQSKGGGDSCGNLTLKSSSLPDAEAADACPLSSGVATRARLAGLKEEASCSASSFSPDGCAFCRAIVK